MRLSVWIAVGLWMLSPRPVSAEPPDPRAEVDVDVEVGADDVDEDANEDAELGAADVARPYLVESGDALSQLAQIDDGDPPVVEAGFEPGLDGEPVQPPAAEASPVPPEPIRQPSAAAPSAPTVVTAPASPEVAGRPKADPVFAEWGEPGSEAGPSEQRIHAAVMFGVGASFDETPGGVNPLGFGFGLRGDYRLLPQLAVGGRFLYYVGSSAALPAGDITMSTWLLAAEAAYVWPVHGLLIEPGLVLGIHSRAVDGRAPFADGRGGFVEANEDRTDVGFYLAPGASVIVPLALFSPDLEPFFVGGDARIGFVFADEVSGSFELMVQAGLRF